MFYILCVIGSLLIAVGIYNDKNLITDSIADHLIKNQKKEEMDDLKVRVTKLEEIIYYDIPVLDEDVQPIRNLDVVEPSDDFVSYKNIAEEVNSQMTDEDLISSSLGLEKFNLLCQYEKEDRSIEEICTLLNMNKGEVLLLKGLYKNYQV